MKSLYLFLAEDLERKGDRYFYLSLFDKAKDCWRRAGVFRIIAERY